LKLRAFSPDIVTPGIVDYSTADAAQVCRDHLSVPIGTELQLRYLADCCVPVSEVSGRQHLRSASRRNWIFRGFVTAHLASGFSQSPVRRLGTHCLIRCVIRPSSLNVLGGTWKRTLETWAH